MGAWTTFWTVEDSARCKAMTCHGHRSSGGHLAPHEEIDVQDFHVRHVEAGSLATQKLEIALDADHQKMETAPWERRDAEKGA